MTTTLLSRVWYRTFFTLTLFTLPLTPLLTRVAEAATYYVAPPATIAITALYPPVENATSRREPLEAGRHVNVEAGSYVGFISGWDDTGTYGIIAGTAGNPITIQADPAAAPGSVIINSRNNKTPCGINLEPGCHYVTIAGFTITNDGSIRNYGIKAAQSDNVNILNNTVHGVGATGIFTSFSSNGIIQGNVSYSNGEHGIYVSNSPQNVQVLDNIGHDNANGGIQMNADASMGGLGTAKGLVFANNIIYNNGTTGGGAFNFDGLQTPLVENNLLYNNHASGYPLPGGRRGGGEKTILSSTIRS